MKNKNAISKVLEKEGYKLGCYDRSIENLTQAAIKKIISSIGYGSSDVYLTVRKKDYIVEVNEVDGEYDFSLITRAEYENRYGIIEESDWKYNK